MSATRAHLPEVAESFSEPGPRRVREQAREALAVMAFSAAVSVTCSLLLLLSHLAGR
ncbi:hypothetical protein ACFQ0K_01040 [Nocardioides caeni]|uniref:hypothetical protein n=1 Tax=Nocardioides caeni TaxID=574700 RepID=UPI00130520CF|nr:hypothetical protein [Nocardioides caeni]